MPRFILIDNRTGHIFGDTATLPSHTFHEAECAVSSSGLTPIVAARWLDETDLAEHGRLHEEVSSLATDEPGYIVYRADINGNETIGTIQDGQDAATIRAVKRDCRLVAFVRCGCADV